MIATLVSQAVSRKMNRENFYDALLTQDGHRLEHVRPPRGLQEWQQLPVSAIANFQPVVLRDPGVAEIHKVLKAHPYQRFPVIKDGKLAGILTRKEAEVALAEKHAPRLEGAATCLPGQTIRQLEVRLIESTTHLIVLTDAEGQNVLGLVTLHDLLRAEVEKAKSGEE
jgi:CIC family chloride channel protein